MKRIIQLSFFLTSLKEYVMYKMSDGMIYYDDYKTRIGELRIVCDDDFLLGIYFDKREIIGIKGMNPMIEKTKEWLDNYFLGNKQEILPIRLEGSEFSKIVWNLLLEIPYGEVTTYGEITRRVEEKMHKRMSYQAVGAAIGRNPISIMIPCHRVVGKDHSLRGYAGGLQQKVLLLELEGNLICKVGKDFPSWKVGSKDNL